MIIRPFWYQKEAAKGKKSWFYTLAQLFLGLFKSFIFDICLWELTKAFF
jgi:hypothetical protein